MSFAYLYPVVVLIQIAGYFFVFFEIGTPRSPFWRSYALIGAEIFVTYYVMTFLLHLPSAGVLQASVRTMLMLQPLFLDLKDSVRKRLYMLLGFLGLTLAAEPVSFWVMKLWGIQDYAQEMLDFDPGVYMPAMVFTADYLLFLGLMTVICYCLFSRTQLYKLRYVVFFTIFLSLHMVFVVVFYQVVGARPPMMLNYIMLFYQLIFFVLLLTQYYLSLRAYRLRNAQEQLTAVQAEMSYNYAYYQMAEERFRDISHIRHDIQNQFQTVEALLADNAVDEAKQSMSEIGERLRSQGTAAYSENSIINAVLTVKAQTAAEAGIALHFALRDCGHLSIENYDLCSVFSNLMDNGIEAAKRAGGAEPYILMKSMLRGHYFVIHMENSAPPVQRSGRRLISAKTEEGHGLGTQILEEIARKYGGSYSLHYEEGVAVTTVLLGVQV